jgi:hypothetical protein
MLQGSSNRVVTRQEIKEDQPVGHVLHFFQLAVRRSPNPGGAHPSTARPYESVVAISA